MNWPFDDGSDLPLRDGFDVGGAQERKMASMVGGYSGIRTVEELNPDGSITTLRTRGGNPIFETEMIAVAPPQALCIRGDLYAWHLGVSVAAWPTVWYVDPNKLLSTDGLWRVDKSQWKRWTARAGQSGASYVVGNGNQVHFNFSSPTTAATLEPLSEPSDMQFTEGEWAARTWHPVREGFLRWSGMTALVQRLNELTLRATGVVFPQGGQSLTWSFSDDSSPASTITSKPACINQSGVEQGLASRSTVIVDGGTRTAYLNITIAGKQATLKTVPTLGNTPMDGFLPTVKERAVNILTLPSVTEAYYANDLAKINMMGQAIHGVCQPSYPAYGIIAGVKNPGYPLRVTSGYQAPSSPNTRYTKIPGLPVPPDPELPENADLYPSEFVTYGDRFYNDIVWSGGSRYSPIYDGLYTTLQLSSTQWIHVDDAGVPRVLSISLTTPLTASSSSFSILNHGPIVFGSGIGAGVVLATVTITTTDPAAVAEYTSLNTTDKVRFHVGNDDVQRFATFYTASYRQKRDPHGYVLATRHHVPHSPDGRQIALFRGLWFKNYKFWEAGNYYRRDTDMIHTVATVNISSDLVVSSPVDVFQWQRKTPEDRETTFTYTPSGSNYLEYANTTVTPWTDVWCKMVAYRTDGGLSLVTEETHFEASLEPKLVAVRGAGYTPRDPMIFPSEVAADVNMAPPTVTMRGFGENGLESYSPPPYVMVFSSQSYRMSNNVLHWYIDGSDARLVTPNGMVMVSDIFDSPTFSPGEGARYASWNPRTDTMAGLEMPYITSDPFTAFISWA